MTLGGIITRSHVREMFDDEPMMVGYLLRCVLVVAGREGVSPVGALNVRHVHSFPGMSLGEEFDWEQDEAYVWELKLA